MIVFAGLLTEPYQRKDFLSANETMIHVLLYYFTCELWWLNTLPSGTNLTHQYPSKLRYCLKISICPLKAFGKRNVLISVYKISSVSMLFYTSLCFIFLEINHQAVGLCRMFYLEKRSLQQPSTHIYLKHPFLSINCEYSAFNFLKMEN